MGASSPSAAASAARSGSPIDQTSTVDHTNAAMQTTNTPAVPLTASTRPPIPGPRKMLVLSMVPAIAFDAVSSSGVPASAGVSAAWAGRNTVETTAMAVAST